MKALSQVAARCGSLVKVWETYDAAAFTLCTKDRAVCQKLKCIQRQISSCSTDNIVSFFQPLAEEASKDTDVYSKWKCVKVYNKNKEASKATIIFSN